MGDYAICAMDLEGMVNSKVEGHKYHIDVLHYSYDFGGTNHKEGGLSRLDLPILVHMELADPVNAPVFVREMILGKPHGFGLSVHLDRQRGQTKGVKEVFSITSPEARIQRVSHSAGDEALSGSFTVVVALMSGSISTTVPDIGDGTPASTDCPFGPE